MKLELLITHHPSTSDVKKAQDSLNIKGFKYDKSNPKILGFHEYFKQFRVRDLEPIFSRSVIDLPFAVKKDHKLQQGERSRWMFFMGIDLVANQDDDHSEVDSGGEDFENQRVWH